MPANPFSRDPAVTVGVGADTDGFNDEIDGATEKLGTFRMAVGAAGAALGALATGALAKSASAAANFEEAMVEVEKVTSPETAEKMSDSIQDLATEIPLAQDELAGLAADAGRFGVTGPENIENFTESVAKMAEATDLSATEAGESLARLSQLTNTPISEIENLGSVINSLSNSMATSSQEVVDSMMRSSAALSQLGLNQREIAGLSASLNEVSESSERAGTRLRRLSQELMNPKKIGDIAAALGMTQEEFVQMRKNSPNELITEMASAMGEGGETADALRQALSTTSRQALGALSQNLEGAAEAQETANRSFEEGTSLQEEFDAATDTFNAQLQLTKNRFRNLAIEVGNVLLPPLSKLLKRFNDLMFSSDSLVSSLTAEQKAFGLVAMAIGGAATAAASFLPVGSALATTFTLLTGPVGAVAAGLTAFGVAYRRNIAGIGDKTNKTAGKFLTAVQRVKSTLKSQLITPFQTAGSQSRQTLSEIRSEFQQSTKIIRTAVNRLTNAVWTNGFQPFLNNLDRLWKAHFAGEDGIVANARTAMNALWGNVIRPVLNLIQAAWNRFDDDVIRIVRGLVGTLQTVVSVGLNNLLGTVNIILDLLSGDFEGAWETMVEVGKTNLKLIAEWLGGSGKTLIGGAIGLIVSAIKAPFEELYDWLIGNSLIKDLINDSVSWLEKTGKSLAKGAFETVTDGVEKGVDYLIGTGEGTLYGDAKSALRDIITYIEDDATSDIKSAMTSMFDGLGSAASNAFEDAFNSSIPDQVSIPSTTVAGKKIGGGSIDLPSLDTGGYIEKRGLAMLHAGERVVQAAKVDRDGGGDDGPTIHVEKIEASSYEEGRAAGRGLLDEAESHGL
ncbi:phage tail tape measure protein [Halosimplex sp. J119]